QPVFRALQHRLRHQAVVGDLVDAHAGQDVGGAGNGIAFIADLGGGVGMGGQVEARGGEVVERVGVMEHEDCVVVLRADAKAHGRGRHFHVDVVTGGVVVGNAVAVATGNPDQC